MTQYRVLRDRDTGFWAALYRGGERVGRLRTHTLGDCEKELCDVHNRPWKFLDLPLVWRADRGLMEQVCGHGIGHPSPSEHAFRTRLGQDVELVHACCGCCGEWYE